MKTILSRNKGANTRIMNGKAYSLHPVVEGREEIAKIVNKNLQGFYTKMNIPEKGDYVTCCRPEEALKQSEDRSRNTGGSFKLDVVFRVRESSPISETFGVFGDIAEGGNMGVYLEAVRMATQEEIETFKEKQGFNAKEAKQKYNLNGHKHN